MYSKQYDNMVVELSYLIEVPTSSNQACPSRRSVRLNPGQMADEPWSKLFSRGLSIGNGKTVDIYMSLYIDNDIDIDIPA